jgi:ankyrin repeat protein
MKKAFFCVLLLVFAAGCSSSPPYEAAAYIASIKTPKYKESDDAYNMLAAVAYDDIAMVRKLLKKGVNADIPLSPEGMRALMIAAESGNTAIVKLLLENKADVNAKNDNGGTALSIAVGVRLMNIKNMDSIRLLMKAGANVNSQDQAGTAPLHLAISNRDREVVEMLIERDANVNAITNLSGGEGQTPLHFLANPWKLPKDLPWDDIEIAKLLLQHGANPNIRAKDGVWPKTENITPLSLAYEADNKKLVDLLISHGADVNVGVRKEISLFHLAVKKNDMEMVRTLIARHADIKVVREQSYSTPFHYAVRYSSAEIVELLIAAYPEMVNEGGGKRGAMNLLETAADSGRIEIVKLLLENGADVSSEGKEGYNMPLHFAKTREIAELLISKGMDVNARRQSLYTPLLMAAARRNPEVVRCLIAHGADVNARNKESQTPLHRVAKDWNKDIVEMLLANGADINAKDYRGQTFVSLVRDEIKMKAESQDNLKEMQAFLDKLEKKPEEVNSIKY